MHRVLCVFLSCLHVVMGRMRPTTQSAGVQVVSSRGNFNGDRGTSFQWVDVCVFSVAVLAYPATCGSDLYQSRWLDSNSLLT